MADKRDYYEVLGVNKSASDDEIKKAFRKMAKQYHPDVNSGDKGAEARFKEVNEAYEVLSDPQKRSQYDQFGHDGPQGAGFGNGFSGFGNVDFGDIGDIFENFFGGSGFGRSGRQRNSSGPMRGADLKYSIQIAFEEAAFGTEKEIKLNRMENCTTCNGTGAKSGTSAEKCRHCGGSGQVQVKQSTPFGQFVNVKTCDVCRGEGKVIANPCQSCSGSGKTRKSVNIKVKIPAGIDEGQTISLRGEGEPGSRGGPSGDLYIEIRVKAHPVFQRKGNDVICEMPVTFVQASLGSEIDVPTLDGKVRYNMPEGTQTGSVFRLKNKGIPALRGGGRGDQYVKVNVEVPRKLSEKQKSILRTFAEASGDEVHEQRRKFFSKMKDAFGMQW